MVVIVAVMSNICMDCRFYLPCTFLCIWTHSPLTPGIMFYDRMFWLACSLISRET
eukprot:jgi/Botrbrau1/9398/Bobra.0252s0023.1